MSDGVFMLRFLVEQIHNLQRDTLPQLTLHLQVVDQVVISPLAEYFDFDGDSSLS